jgi:hypothetical protein
MTNARLVINTTRQFGSIRTISEHTTVKDAIKAGVQYRKDNPHANTLEVYAHGGDEGPAHLMEDYTWPLMAAK